MTKEEYCALWQNSRDKAMDKGFQMDLVCPLEEVCHGETCVYISGDSRDKSKLGELRRELDNILKVTLHDPKTEDK